MSQIAGLCRFSRKNFFLKSKWDKVKLSNWHPPAFLGVRDLIWKHSRRHWYTRVVLLNGTSLHKSKCPFLHHFQKSFLSSFTRLVTTLVVLPTIIESRQHADCELKIPAKIWHSFTLFLYIFFCNFEVKIARFIKLHE